MGEHDGDSACAQCGHEKRVHYFHHRHGPRHPDRGMPVHCDGIDAGYAWSECLCPGFYPAPPDPRDAEIAALKAEVERLRDGFDVQVEAITRRDRAIAAGPAAVRRQENVDVNTREAYARVVEVAQAAAMKEKP